MFHAFPASWGGSHPAWTVRFTDPELDAARGGECGSYAAGAWRGGCAVAGQNRLGGRHAGIMECQSEVLKQLL